MKFRCREKVETPNNFDSEGNRQILCKYSFEIALRLFGKTVYSFYSGISSHDVSISFLWYKLLVWPVLLPLYSLPGAGSFSSLKQIRSRIEQQVLKKDTKKEKRKARCLVKESLTSKSSLKEVIIFEAEMHSKQDCNLNCNRFPVFFHRILRRERMKDDE